MSPPRELLAQRNLAKDELGASLWLLGGWVLVSAYLFAQAKLSRELAIAAVLLGGVAVVWRVAAKSPQPRRQSKGGRPLTVTAAAAVVAAVGTFINFQFAVGGEYSPGRVATELLACAVVFASAADSRVAMVKGVTPGLLVIIGNLVLAALYLRGHPARIDVEVVLREGVGEFLAGHNPYAMTFTNPYAAEESRLFYAPGILVDNRISLGFPYPPVVLLSAVPGYLLGDVRFSGLIMVTWLALAIHGRGHSAVQRSQAVAVATAPGLLFALSNAWTETLSVTLLGLSLLAFRRRNALFAGALLAAFFASKQYLVVALPCLWMLRAHARRAPVIAFCATGSALMVPWALADMSAFWRALSGAYAGGLVRADSISVLVQGILTWGWEESPLYRWLPVVVGLVVAFALAARLAQGSRSFAAAVGVTVMATVLVSKQSFFNYYYLVSMCFVLSAVIGSMTSSRADPKLVTRSACKENKTVALGASSEPGGVARPHPSDGNASADREGSHLRWRPKNPPDATRQCRDVGTYDR